MSDELFGDDPFDWRREIASREVREVGGEAAPEPTGNGVVRASATGTTGQAANSDALKLLDKILYDAYDAWDNDRDLRVGKILLALAGQCPGYRADIDRFRALLEAGRVACVGCGATADPRLTDAAALCEACYRRDHYLNLLKLERGFARPVSSAEEVASAWLARQIVADGREPMLDEGDCRLCGQDASEGHEPTDPCGIIENLLRLVRETCPRK